MALESVSIRLLPVIVAVVVSMVVGFVWYHRALFGKPWMAYIGRTEDQLKTGMAKAMSFTVVGSFLTYTTLAFVLAWMTPAGGALTWVDGLLGGLVLWLGMVAVSIFVHDAFEQKPTGLSALKSGSELVTMSLNGIILAVWTAAPF